MVVCAAPADHLRGGIAPTESSESVANDADHRTDPHRFPLWGSGREVIRWYLGEVKNPPLIFLDNAGDYAS